MSLEFEQQKKYDYTANSNLVLEADRGEGGRRRHDEATGEVEVWDEKKLSGKRMGDRVGGGRTRAPEVEERLQRSKEKRERELRGLEGGKKIAGGRTKESKKGVFSAGRGATVLTETEALEAINYRPRHPESKRAYEEMLGLIKGNIGDQPQDILRGAADEVLAILKDESLTDPRRLTEIQKLIRKLSPEKFNKLVTLGKGIHDFNTGGAGGEGQGEEEDEKQVLDEEMGVRVEFDRDEEEEEESDLDEVVEEDEDEEEEEEGEEGGQGGGRERQLGKYYEDANISAKLAEDVLAILGGADELDCESKLVVLLDVDKFDFIKKLMKNRGKILFCTRLKQAQSQAEKKEVEAEMLQDVELGGPAILKELYQKATAESWAADRQGEFVRKTKGEARGLGGGREEGRGAGRAGGLVEDEVGYVPTGDGGMVGGGKEGKAGKKPQQSLDLEALSFSQGSHLNSNKKVVLPEGTWRALKKGYEEVHVPAVKHVPDANERLVEIEELPAWTHRAFEGMTMLNRVQSKMCSSALYSSENLLLCAPTGAGKTNVAMLCILNEIGQHLREDGSVDLDAFKIVYVAPMKALVQECVLNFGKRLAPFGIAVRELSGDQSLTRAQINSTQVIVTTPEKWDIITRKAGDRTYTQLVRLMIIDEIHLLHDERGPVLESIVARTIRQIETTQEMVRIVGLSATLPNYEDVATFLRVNPDKGLFFFDNSYRPVPLQQQYIGITERKAIKRFQLMNEICYEKVLEQAGQNQVLIFVHSRAETAKTAKALRELAIENDTVGQFVAEDGASKAVLVHEAEQTKNEDLKDLLPYGFAIHHAGMNRADRTAVEDLFAAKHAQVLVSTATLAWGVNLPAHTVIIKGTQIYNPEKGRWTELSPLDIMQMMGRAGRPQYDSSGEGIIITQHSELQYYLSLMNRQLPVESQYVKRLTDNMNAEIVLGSVQTLREAVHWLGYTYLYVRMLRNPTLYGVGVDEAEKDPLLEQRRTDLVHTAASTLDKNNLIKYDRKTGAFQVTPLGRVAAYYYITHQSMAVYADYLKPTMSDIELFRLFSLSSEFKNIHVREEEKLELAKLAARVPIPIKDSIEDSLAKVNVLLQAYISGLRLEGFALVADMQYVQQSANRIMRALFEISLKKGWAALADKTLNLCKMAERRMWLSQSPLRQFRAIPEAIARKLEKKDIPWERYFDMTPQDLGELIKLPRMGKPLHQFVHQFPKVELSVHVQPITRSLLKVELTVHPDFIFNVDVHENGVLFWIMVEDADQEQILHYEPFLLKAAFAGDEHVVNFTVPILDPLPPQYFVRVVADRWLHSETVQAISFRSLILPNKFPPHTELLDLQPLPISALRAPTLLEPVLAARGYTHFNALQTQAFTELYDTDNNVLICAPPGSGKKLCAEFAMFRLFKLQVLAEGDGEGQGGKVVYVHSKAEAVKNRYADWASLLGEKGPLNKRVVMLTGDATLDNKLLESADVAVSTAEAWDVLSRRWRQRKAVQQVSLFISDDLHLIGSSGGSTLEMVVSRMRLFPFELERKVRIVGLAACVANAKDIGDWIGATAHGLFNFRPDVPGVRPVPLEIHVQGFEISHFSSRMLSMAKPVYNAVAGHGGKDGKPSLVVVPSRKQAQLTAIDLITYAAAAGDPKQFLRGSGKEDTEDDEGMGKGVKEVVLRDTLAKGVGFVHQGMAETDRRRVWDLYEAGILQVVVVPQSMVWSVTARAHAVVIMGTEYYEGREHRYVDYPMTDLLQMMGLASRPGKDRLGLCVVMCHNTKKEYLKRLLYEPLPVESHLNHFLHDHLNAEVVNKTVETQHEALQILTWTFFYRRLVQNPNYYGLRAVGSRQLSEFLSDLVESVVEDLARAKMLEVEEDVQLSPLNLGMIAAYYYVQYTTIELFASSVTAKTKVKGLLEILSSASEYGDLAIRQGEERVLQQLATRLPQKLPEGARFTETHVKALVLLQAHFSRMVLPTELRQDQRSVVGEAPRMLQALVDVVSSECWLKPCIAAMELCQMVVQGLWDRDSYLLQIPHFTKEIVKRCEALADPVESPLGILELDDDVREKLLQLPPAKMADVARFCNAYPNIDLEWEVVGGVDSVVAGKPISVVVTLERETEGGEEEEGGVPVTKQVVAPLYPKPKMEAWWLIVGDPARNSLLFIKRVNNVAKRTRTRLNFAAPTEAGDHDLKLYFICDSYMGADQEYDLSLSVLPGESDEEESESEGEKMDVDKK
ncbi:u5 small nuclear ribonucleoprotein helicase [Nannochloropsis gaditana]|uniref:RNA helicase n=2 Tax=Nannochloropsis gaditana TaxID=72520 RepID=W7TFU8_9STRA|nr:u5 small nuclear ribonucleoprotein helicase [Nannochloropsis gaditana]